LPGRASGGYICRLAPRAGVAGLRPQEEEIDDDA
jgi:hypothetical protein